MYHKLANPETIELIEDNPLLKQFIREASYKFKVFAMTHDPDLLKSSLRHVQDIKEERPAVYERYKRHGTRVMLAYESGVPFGTVKVTNGHDKEGRSVDAISFCAEFVKKARGRGSERHTRDSISVKALIKAIKADIDENGEECFRSSAEYAFRGLVNKAADVFNSRYSPSLRFSSEALINMMNHIRDKEQLDAMTTKELDVAFKQLEESKDRKNKILEVVRRYIGDCYYVTKQEHCPIVVSRITVQEDPNVPEGLPYIDAKIKVTTHPDVKCYADIDELAKDCPDLVVSLKMFDVKINDNDKIFSRPYPITQYVPYLDKLDIDLDIFCTSNHQYGLNGFNSNTQMIVKIV